MSVVVKLDAIVQAMERPQAWESLLDPETGEIVTISEEERYGLDREDYDPDDFPEWLQKSVERVQRVLDSGRALRLPDAYDIHEWNLMRRFSSSIDDRDQRDELLAAIHGSGAFRLFKMTVARLGLREEWFKYRDGALRQIAVDWLEANGIEYVDDEAGEGRSDHDQGS